MRILLGAGRLLKNCKFRVRWYSTEKPFLPPNDGCETVKRAIEARARRLTHLTRLRPVDVKDPETPALDTVSRALASSSGSSSRSKEPNVKGSSAQQGRCLSNQTLSSKPPQNPLIPTGNIKQQPQVSMANDNSCELEIFNCKCDEQSSGEDLETSALELFSCKNWKANESVLKKDLSEQGSTVPASPPAKASSNVPQKEPQVKDSTAKPPVKGTQEKANAPSSQSEKPPQNLTDAATMPSASPSPFPSGRNPCTDGKRGDGEKQSSCSKTNVKVEEKKENSCNKQEIKPPVKETAQKCASPKIDDAKSEVKPSQEVAVEPKKPACAKFKKGTPSKAKCPAKAKEKNKDSEEKKPTKSEVNPCSAKSQAKPSQDVVAEPKAEPQSQAAKEWKQPPLPTSKYSFPLLSSFPTGRNPCRDGPRGGSGKECKPDQKPKEEQPCPKKKMSEDPCRIEKASDALKKPKEKPNEISDPCKGGKTQKSTKEIKPSTDPPKGSPGVKPSGSVPTESVKEAVKASEKVMSEAQKASAEVTNKADLKDASKKVVTEAQKASAAVANTQELKDASKKVLTEAEKASQSISNKGKSVQPATKVPSQGADTSTEPKKPVELKKFPAAPLNRTLTAYLDSIEPLLTPKEFKKEVELTEEFEKNEGQKLQELLEKAADESRNWLTPRWTKAAYLAYQAPVTVFTSPALSFPVQNFKEPMDCLFFTARAIRAIYDFKKLVDADRIPVAKMGENVLDNSQFVDIFGTIRKPARFCDTIEQYSESDYVVVVYQNNFFQLPILSSSGNLLSANSLVYELMAIVQCPLARGEPYGLLTHDNRDNWAEAYATMQCRAGNAATLEAIEQSLFVVCLDKEVPIPKGQEFMVQAHQLLHGGGVEENSGNRWMDKTIQLIVNPNGLAGFCYEHSPAECQPLAMLMDYVVEKIESESKSESESESESKECNSDEKSSSARLMKFQPNDECVNMWLHVAMRNIMKTVYGLRIHVFHYDCHGKEFIKAQGLNSDSYIQMALQLAYYNMHNTIPAQYETGHLRIFVDGRTETIRSTSNESVAFVKAMKSDSATQIEKMKALQKAVDFHEELTKRALNGEGIDRHLFGLQQMALENGLPVPEFFKSKGFVRSGTFQLFTSQVATANNGFMVYGPGTYDGYGCCYNPQNDKITFAISAWQSSLAINPEAYGKAIKKSLDTMRRLVLKTGGDRVGENPCRCELILI